MRARTKAEIERIKIEAHQGEAMARQKRLKDIEHYLKPKAANDDAALVAASLANAEKMGMNVRVRRLSADATEGVKRIARPATED